MEHITFLPPELASPGVWAHLLIGAIFLTAIFSCLLASKKVGVAFIGLIGLLGTFIGIVASFSAYDESSPASRTAAWEEARDQWYEAWSEEFENVYGVKISGAEIMSQGMPSEAPAGARIIWKPTQLVIDGKASNSEYRLYWDGEQYKLEVSDTRSTWSALPTR